MTKLVTNGAGVVMLVGYQKSLPRHPAPPFSSNISSQSKNRIINALASNTVSFLDTAKRCPQLSELAATVASENEIAASELGLLSDYHYTVYCMTN